MITEEPDYTGVPLRQLRARIETALHPKNPNRKSKQFICAKSGLDHRELSRILKTDKNNIISLGKADRILMALGENIGVLSRRGLIDVVPLGAQKANAERMVEDFMDVREVEASPDRIKRMAVKIRRRKAMVLSLLE